MKSVLHGATYMLVALLFATNLLLTGCGSSAETTTSAKATADSLTMATENQRLSTENSQLRKTVAQLEQDKKALNAKVADLTSKLGQSSQQWQDLQDLQARVNELDSELTVQKQINRDLSAKSAEAEKESMGSGMSTVTTKAEFKSNYDSALKLFKDRNYKEALATFQNLSTSKADPQMVGNAFYWMGECYYAIQKYPDAVKAFQNVLTFPKSYKEGAAYIMLGMSYLRLGDKAHAKSTWESFIKKYPKSQYVARAKQYLSQL